MTATRNNSFKWPFLKAVMAFVAWMAIPAVAASNTLSIVSVSEGQNQSQVIKFVLKDPVKDLPVSFTTSNPHRLVLDFSNTDSSLGRVQETLQVGGIKNYQVIQSGDRTRVVFSLAGPASHELRKDKNVVLAVLQVAQVQGETAAETSAAPVRFAETGKNKDHGIKDVDFRRGKNGEGRLAITLSDPGVGIDIQQKGKSIQVDFLNTALPGPLQRRMDVTDFATPTQMVEMFEQGKNARMLVTPKGRWDYSAYQTGNQFIMEVRPVDDANLAKGDKPIYTGEKLTLNFQNVEVRSVLQVIADFTSLNIIASDTVAGNLTLRLKDVPWDQALDIILRAKGLDKRATGNVIWVAPRDELAAKEKAELEAKQQISELEELVTEVISLNYLRAPDAYAMLLGKSITATQTGKAVTCATAAEGVGGRTETASGSTGAAGPGNTNSMLSKRGTANFDLKTNSLFVQDTPSRIEKMKKLLAEIDKSARQIMIEARVVLADESFSRNLGARLGIKTTGRIDGTSFGISGGGESATTIASSGISTATPIPYNVNLPAGAISGSPPTLGIGIINAASTALIGLELQALELDNRGKIVSNPRVITQNQHPAVILQGQQIPYTTANSAGATATNTTSFVDALLCLLVDPQVLNNEDVILDVEVQKDAPGDTLNTQGQPPIDRRRVKTQVRVRNGETAILGGIFEQTTRNDTNKVPLLGDIPVIGALFKTNYRTDEKTELMIFLTPRLLDEGPSLVR